MSKVTQPLSGRHRTWPRVNRTLKSMLLLTTVIQWPYQTGLICPFQKSKFLGQGMHYSKSSFLARRDYPQDAGLPGVCLCWARAHAWSNPSRGGSTQQSHIWRGCHRASPVYSPVLSSFPTATVRSAWHTSGTTPKVQGMGMEKKNSRVWTGVFHQAPRHPLQISIPALLEFQIFLLRTFITYGLPALHLGQCESKILSRVLYIYSSKEIQS